MCTHLVHSSLGHFERGVFFHQNQAKTVSKRLKMVKMVSHHQPQFGRHTVLMKVLEVAEQS